MPAEEQICSGPNPNLALQNELLDIRAQLVLISYPVAFKTPSYLLLLKFQLTRTIFKLLDTNKIFYKLLLACLYSILLINTCIFKSISCILF